MTSGVQVWFPPQFDQVLRSPDAPIRGR